RTTRARCRAELADRLVAATFLDVVSLIEIDIQRPAWPDVSIAGSLRNIQSDVVARLALGGRNDLVGYHHLCGVVHWRAAFLRHGSFTEGGSEPAPRHARPHTS